MNRYLALALVALAAAPAWSQGNAPAANVPKGNAPAAAANTPANAAAGGNAPAAAAGGKKLGIRVPSGGEYTAYVQEQPADIQTVTDHADLEVPAGVKSFTVYVLDKQSGYAARKTVAVGSMPAELSFSSPDFKLVQKVQVHVTGKGDKPVSQGVVILTDGGHNQLQKVLQPSSQGTADFDFVVNGKGTVAVAPLGGSKTIKEVNLDLPKGETTQSVTVSLPEVTAVVEPAPGTAPAANAAAGAGPTAAAPAAAPAPAQAPPANNGGGGYGQVFIGFVVLAAIGYGLYVWAKNRGLTVQHALTTMGVQPDAVAVGGGSLAGANLATGVAAPGAPPAPPPIVADPNQCPFCGQMKDGGGNCACTVAPGQAASMGGFGGAAPVSGSGPRLVGMAGTYMGEVFPLPGMAVIGREPTNPVPLDRDTTTSRRHAQITADGGSYRIQDLGSSNGTFVNGARVSEAVLSPGDEVGIGGTRFRFEV